MSMRGGCPCGNVQFLWRNVDFSLVPRACNCDYCSGRGAAWLSKSRTALEVSVRNTRLQRFAEQGSMQARFHECTHCDTVVWVGTRIDGEIYGAVNLACLRDSERFIPPRPVVLTELTAEEKLSRWQQNWCCPVTIEPALEGL